jgi:non-ribosomal peptide synthetase component E (peptide arylation enzyme)
MRFETRLSDELIERYQQSGHWGAETFHAILARRAAVHPDRVAIVDRGRRITYGELKTRVDRVAAGLGALGIRRGDVVTIQLPNWAEFADVFFALECLGAVANQIGPDFRTREVDYILRFSESRAFVCPASFKSFDYVKMIGELRPGLPDLQAVCVLGGAAGPGRVSLDALVENATAVAPPSAHQGANDVMRMAFTSGTTGNPKA